MTAYKTVGGEIVEIEKYYTVGEPDCGGGCCTPVYTADMKDEGPLFYVETEHKAQLAAELLGVTEQELQIVLDTRKEMIADGATIEPN